MDQNNQTNQLTVLETESEFLVVWDNNPADWVARFKKDGDLPAQMWAERMKELYQDKTCDGATSS